MPKYEEYNHPVDDNDCFEIPIPPPLKRIKTDQPAANIYINGDNSADTEMNDLSFNKVVESTDSAEVNLNTLYNKLQEIQSSNKSEYMLSIYVADVCA